MAKRPTDVDPETWRAQRARVWARRNWILNLLMVVVVIAVVWRNCGSVSA